jgi:hypothetical protein
LDKLQKFETEDDQYRLKYEAKVDECEVGEREYHKLQEKHRDLLNSEYQLQTVKEHLEG